MSYVFLAGIPVGGDQILALASLVKDPALAGKLVDGVQRDTIAIRLDESELNAVLKALGADPPPDLRAVHEKLLEERRRRAAAQPDFEAASLNGEA